jgi:hypothetical protein
MMIYARIVDSDKGFSLTKAFWNLGRGDGRLIKQNCLSFFTDI